MSRKFGIEIEFLIPEDITLAKIARKLRNAGIATSKADRLKFIKDKWKITEDGSVSAEGFEGAELVSPPLEFNDESITHIRKVCDIVNQLGGCIKACCGLHVHVDVSDLTVSELKHVYRRYARFEQTIDSFMPASRRENRNTYCRSVASLGNYFFAARNIDQLSQRLPHERYHKVNIQSYSKYKTIEFRQHSGTTDPEKIINWVKFCIGFVEASHKTSINDEVVVPEPNIPGIKDNSKKLKKVVASLSDQRHASISHILSTLNIDADELRNFVVEINDYFTQNNIRARVRLPGPGMIRYESIADNTNNETFESLTELECRLEGVKIIKESTDPSDFVFANMDQDVVTYYTQRSALLAEQRG